MAMTVRRNKRVFVIGTILLILLFLGRLTRFYTDLLWFREARITSVLWASLTAQLLLGLAVGLFVASIVFLNLLLAGRMAPAYGIFRVESIRRVDPMAHYREAVLPYARWLRLGISLLLGVLTGVGASSSWQTFLLYLNRVPFGTKDPQFGKDVGFYVFELPLFKAALSWLRFSLLAALVLTVVAHYLYGSIRPEGGLRGVTSKALAHISVLLGFLALVKAVQYFLGQYELNFSPRGVVTGASYTDVHAQLPALRILAVISIISALLFLANIRFRSVALPLAAVGIWILIAFLAGGVWPWWVQRFSVRPQEPQREAPFISRNLEATKDAFGLETVEAEPFAASEDLSQQELTDNEPLLQNVRVWDPDVLRTAYSQLQAIRTYYQFPDVDIDRYDVEGQVRQVLLSARELSIEDLNPASKTWSNLHLQYTHGYGLVASLANEATTAGQPSFLVKDVPGTVTQSAPSLDVEQPGIYYGEGFESNEYSIVNSRQQEIDFESENEVRRSNYAGAGGIQLGGFLNRLAFAIRERDTNLVLSGLITSDSRIMIYKNVRDRVLRAAPFLSLDNDPYMAVVDGRLKWVVDAYTSTPWYPYAQRFDLADIIDTTQAGTLSGDANYVRNSVKVVVDAYDGTMDFYIVDPNDPLIQAWSKTFPSLFTAGEPSEDLRAHFRYPEDLFKIQSDVYLTYHIADPANFYAKIDAWDVPTASETGEEVDPTYLLIQLPGTSEPAFVLTRPFTPRARNNMIAIMVGKSDPGEYGQLLTLDFPRETQIAGPAQVSNLINQDEAVSQARTLLGQQGSDVIFGSLVTLPINDSILYVQPLFLAAQGTTTSQQDQGIPELKRVILVFGERVVEGPNFSASLAELFDLRGGGVAGISEPPPVNPGTGTGKGDTGKPGGDQPSAGGQELARIVDRAGVIYERAQKVLQQGDFETYGRLIDKLGKMLERAQQLSQ
jgi:uncharacterized protein